MRSSFDLSYEPSAILHEPDPNHARMIIRELGLESAREAWTLVEHRSVEKSLLIPLLSFGWMT